MVGSKNLAFHEPSGFREPRFRPPPMSQYIWVRWRRQQDPGYMWREAGVVGWGERVDGGWSGGGTVCGCVGCVCVCGRGGGGFFEPMWFMEPGVLRTHQPIRVTTACWWVDSRGGFQDHDIGARSSMAGWLCSPFQPPTSQGALSRPSSSCWCARHRLLHHFRARHTRPLYLCARRLHR